MGTFNELENWWWKAVINSEIQFQVFSSSQGCFLARLCFFHLAHFCQHLFRTLLMSAWAQTWAWSSSWWAKWVFRPLPKRWDLEKKLLSFYFISRHAIFEAKKLSDWSWAEAVFAPSRVINFWGQPVAWEFIKWWWIGKVS